LSKTITIDDDAYKLLVSLKEGPGDSFTKVIKRKIFVPIENAGELLDAQYKMPPPNVDLELMDKMLKERGRRSGGRK
jgi:predicted CopG family antitoxin